MITEDGDDIAVQFRFTLRPRCTIKKKTRILLEVFVIKWKGIIALLLIISLYYYLWLPLLQEPLISILCVTITTGRHNHFSLSYFLINANKFNLLCNLFHQHDQHPTPPTTFARTIKGVLVKTICLISAARWLHRNLKCSSSPFYYLESALLKCSTINSVSIATYIGIALSTFHGQLVSQRGGGGNQKQIAVAVEATTLFHRHDTPQSIRYYHRIRTTVSM